MRAGPKVISKRNVLAVALLAATLSPVTLKVSAATAVRIAANSACADDDLGCASKPNTYCGNLANQYKAYN